MLNIDDYIEKCGLIDRAKVESVLINGRLWLAPKRQFIDENSVRETFIPMNEISPSDIRFGIEIGFKYEKQVSPIVHKNWKEAMYEADKLLCNKSISGVRIITTVETVSNWITR